MMNFGVNFQFTGGDQAASSMGRIESAYRKLDSATERYSTAMNQRMSSMAAGIKAHAATIGIAIAGVAAAAVAIPGKLAMSRAELTNEQANLRALGLDDAAVARLEENAEKFSSRVAGISKSAYTKAAYDIVSGFSTLTTAEQGAVADMTLTMGKATKMAAENATELIAGLWGAAGDEMKKQGAEPFVREWTASLYGAVKELKTTGPQLQAAAKNSMSVLMSAGWTPQQMTGFWGQLINAGLSGEQAGTMLKQLGLKERGAFGNIMAEASGQLIDTKFLEGLDKTWAEGRNEGLKKRFGEIGHELFRTDPIAWINKLGEAYDKLVAEGKDVNKILSKEFGEEAVGGIISFMQKRGQLKGTIENLTKYSFEDVQKIVHEEMSKGIGPASAILGQLWQNLKETMGRTTGEGASKKIAWLSSGLLQANALWKALFTSTDPITALEELSRAGGVPLQTLYYRLEGFKSVAAGFTESFSSGFSSAFSAISTGVPILEKLAELLDKPDPERWRQLGDELGRLAGTSLGELVESLKMVKNFAAELWEVLGPIVKAAAWLGAKTLGKAREGYSLYQQELLPDLVGLAQGGVPTINRDLATLGLMAPERPQRVENAFPGWTGPRAGERRGMGAGGGAAPQPPPQVTVEQGEVNVNVKIGDREIKDLVKDVQRNEAARYRLGAGDVLSPGF